MEDKNPQTLDFTGERMIPELNRGKAFYYEHLERYLFVMQFCKGKTVLELGCGVGYGANLLIKNGAKSVEAIDLSEESIAYAKAKYGEKNIKFSVGNVEKLPVFPKKFDVIVAFEILEHLENLDDFIEGIKANLAPGGLLCISTPNEKLSDHTNHFHINELTLQQFKTLSRKYFKNFSFFGQAFYFSNILIPLELEKTEKLAALNEEGAELPVHTFSPVIKPGGSKYFIALCSDKKIPDYQLNSIYTVELDEFSLDDSIEGMTRKFVVERAQIVDELNQIKNSKFYRFWILYNKLKKLFGKTPNS